MNELFNHEPRWTVLTRHHFQSMADKIAKKPQQVSHFELLYDDQCQCRRKGESGQLALQEIARFLNRRRLKPRARIECVADAPNPADYLKKCAP